MGAETRVETISIASVLAKALPELGAVHKNKKNPAFKSSYADLSAVLEAIAPIAEHGLWFRQVPVQLDGGVGIETFYVHESGAELSAGVTPVPVNKNDAQGLGSAMTYGRRYGLMTAFGLSADDDDGTAASRAAPRREPEQNAKADEMPDAEWSKLVQLIEATNSDTNAMCKAYKVKNLRQLNQDQYGHAIGRLKDKLAEMARAETNAKAKEPEGFGEVLSDEIPY